MDRIAALIAAMTLEEKIGQLIMASGWQAVTGPVVPADVSAEIRAGRVGAMLNLWGAEAVRAVQKIAVGESRLGIPLLIGLDVLHGHRTIFPIPLGEACAFDPALWTATARSGGRGGGAWTASRWFSRPCLTSRAIRAGAASARAPARTPLSRPNSPGPNCEASRAQTLAIPDAVAATAKHFVAYGAALAGRDYASADVSERTLHEVYLPPFAAAVTEGCAAVMPAFMDLAGVPMTAHRGVCCAAGCAAGRDFEGVIVSDYNAIGELLRHGVAADLCEAAALALNAGVDIDMMSDGFRKGLPQALAQGRVSMEDINASVRRVLTLKQRLGSLRRYIAQQKQPRRRARTLRAGAELARKAAQRSIVMLANDGVLPLLADVRRSLSSAPRRRATRDARPLGDGERSRRFGHHP